MFPYKVKHHKPNNIIVVSEKESLRVFPSVINHTDSCHEVHDLFRRGVVEIVAALMSSVTVYPF